jgi:predicted short-subunit dehydrogenase-like oxidoreductase (DUF2520 family)
MAQDVATASIVLVGPGRAGRAFARSWTRTGGSIVLVARDAPAARTFAREVSRAEVVALDSRVTLAGDVFILAVPDDAIGALARRLARRLACRFAFHFSGALGSAELAPLGDVGAKLGSLHPLRAFSGSKEDDWTDAFVAVEGDEPAARMAVRLSRHVGARPHRLSAGGKPLYHAAATLAAGGTASLLSFATRLWAHAGLAEEEGKAALAGLAAGAVDAVARLPFERALTGPVARRDVETVRLHRDALAPWPELARLYELLARETLRATEGRGREAEIAAVLADEEPGSVSELPRSEKQPDDSRGND